jgi:transcriptional regulator with XRE-family HTH domain
MDPEGHLDLGRCYAKDRGHAMTLEPRPDLGARAPGVRRRLGLSQAAFACLLGVSRNTLAKAERGHLPRAVTLDRVARVGGVTVDWLMQGSRDSGIGRDQAWEGAVGALRLVWRHPRRRRMVIEVLRALGG